MLFRRCKRCVQFAKVVAAAAQRINLLCAHVYHQSPQLWVLVKEMTEVVFTVIGPQVLILAIDHRGEMA